MVLSIVISYQMPVDIIDTDRFIIKILIIITDVFVLFLDEGEQHGELD